MKKITRKNLSSIVGGFGEVDDRQGACLIKGELQPWPCNKKCPDNLNGLYGPFLIDTKIFCQMSKILYLCNSPNKDLI